MKKRKGRKINKMLGKKQKDWKKRRRKLKKR